MDAILTATRNAAQAMKIDDGSRDGGGRKARRHRRGEWRSAADIACLQEKRNIQLVMKEGRLYADRRSGKSRNVVNVKPGEWKMVDYL